MSAKVLEASPESGSRSDPFSSSSASIYVPGTLKNARIGGTSCGLAVVVESATMATEHVGSLTARTLPSHTLVTGGGVGGAAGAGRKRHHSTSKSAGQIKRRRKTYERNGSKPKFLLGGSITDPLNLNSLDDEEISKIANAVTPACSPLPQINKDPDPIIVPQDFKDPLKLNTADDNEENSPLTKTLVSRKSGKKKKYHNSGDAKRDSIESVGNSDRDGESSCTRPLWLELQNSKTTKLANKIVSPVLPDSRGRKRKASRTEPSSRLAKALLIDDLLPQPQPKAKSSEPELKRSRKSPEVVNKFRRQQSHDSKTSKHLPKFREQDKKFQYGNYARYYGYRTPNSDDNRIDLFKREWFEGKKCLDIGCNSGHVTLAVAKLFDPSSIVGVDIDGNLIGVARKNVKHCLEELFREKKGKGRVNFPVSLQKTYGPLAPAASTSSPAEREKSLFPGNVLFRCANFVLKDDSLLETQKEEYNTILCLSVTKWIHLNWGDAGIKRFFKRIYRALYPGGRLILEPQAWQSYQKKRKMTVGNEVHVRVSWIMNFVFVQEW
ncbi:probable RNA methyltransferase Y17G7B.18 [Lytechinus pictus]|uniref:probable RNA methyltransferase Y17G7B.18 n=1 Tax=Lytechinus pictus TaxID=7653 RepID=UPI0030BA0FAC